MKFEETKDAKTDLFDIGLIPYLPRECQLLEEEFLGQPNPYEKENESDFEEDDEEEEENERIVF